VQSFETAFARYLGTPHAISCASGSDALLLALMALGIGPGDAVVTTPYSFFATASSIVRLGARPIFVDIDPVSYNMDLDQLESYLASCKLVKTKKGKALRDPQLRVNIRAILPVHLYGRCCDMNRLMKIAGQYQLKVVEDAAQAVGSDFEGRMAGTTGHVGCFSFYPSKNLGAYGDGGCVITADPELADLLRMLREHGARPRYYHHHLGINSRLDGIQAAVLSVKLNHLDKWNDARRAHALTYRELVEGTGLADNAIGLPETHLGNQHNFHQFIIRVEQRDHFMQALKAHQVGYALYYPLPLHRQPCFAGLGVAAQSCPEANLAADQTLALPMYPELTVAQQRWVVQVLAEAARPSRMAANA
jgi:dTDP-4-amino-4,6-dideoxygalactose transaminase